ncbi:hypothetical protein, partial [Acinetobacter baumannii]|uniref:hypothetical protein n=1 Tax=Acinetobacter baumannii TaxID=470 RepID=UPI0028A17A76
RFPDIGEDEESNLGAGCAFGCEGRVIYGLLELLNSIHRQIYSENFFSDNAVLALCRNASYVNLKTDLVHLAQFGESCGLLEPEVGSGIRRDFLVRQCSALEEKLKKKKPRVM